jgi:hypothetical protein
MELKFPEKSGFFIRNVDGLTPPKATVNITEIASMDGATFNSARLNSRNVVFSLGFLECPTIEDARQKTYKYFPLKHQINIIVETDNRICEVNGVVESNEPTIFDKEEGTVISVVCPTSYLNSLLKGVTNFSFAGAMFEFPFSNESLTEKLLIISDLQIHTTKSVYYDGDIPVGVLIFIHAIGSVTNIRIINTRTREIMAINTTRIAEITGHGIEEGDDIIISTIKGDKFVILQREGVAYNIMNSTDKDRDWFQLDQGDNLFTYTAEAGVENLQFRVENQIAYDGV